MIGWNKMGIRKISSLTKILSTRFKIRENLPVKIMNNNSKIWRKTEVNHNKMIRINKKIQFRKIKIHKTVWIIIRLKIINNKREDRNLNLSNRKFEIKETMVKQIYRVRKRILMMLFLIIKKLEKIIKMIPIIIKWVWWL